MQWSPSSLEYLDPNLFSTAVSESLKCPICFGVFRDPVVVCPQGHSLCRTCLEALLGWQKAKPKRCVLCREELLAPGAHAVPARQPGAHAVPARQPGAHAVPAPSKQVPNLAVRQFVGELIVRCPFAAGLEATERAACYQDSQTRGARARSRSRDRAARTACAWVGPVDSLGMHRSQCVGMGAAAVDGGRAITRATTVKELFLRAAASIDRDPGWVAGFVLYLEDNWPPGFRYGVCFLVGGPDSTYGR
jgi:hypothetical protein